MSALAIVLLSVFGYVLPYLLTLGLYEYVWRANGTKSNYGLGCIVAVVWPITLTYLLAVYIDWSTLGPWLSPRRRRLERRALEAEYAAREAKALAERARYLDTALDGER